jgi:hypothetical protein
VAPSCLVLSSKLRPCWGEFFLCRSDSSRKRPLVRQPCGVAKPQPKPPNRPRYLTVHFERAPSEVELRLCPAHLSKRIGLVPANFPSVSCTCPRFSRPPSASKMCKVGFCVLECHTSISQNSNPTHRRMDPGTTLQGRTRTMCSDKCWIHIGNQPCAFCDAKHFSKTNGIPAYAVYMHTYLGKSIHT